MSEEIEFEVGKKYENVKGVYEVISLDDDTMTIQWETGEQASTSIDLQARIIERIQFEKEMREAKKRTKARRKSRAVGSKMGELFKGFAASDFKETISGTQWRNRNCLGGAVTKRLAPNKQKINSWAVARKAAIQWQGMDHHRLATSRTQAKLFAQIDVTDLCYGFYIERGNQNEQDASDWNAFIAWLAKNDNEASLNTIVSEHQLQIEDKAGQGFTGQIEAHQGQWILKNQSETAEIPSLAAFLDQIPSDVKIDFQMYQKAAKAEVLDQGIKIADHIARLFDVLMPIYKASATLEPAKDKIDL